MTEGFLKAAAAEQLALKESSRPNELVRPARRVGERALWGAGVFKMELGVNDPLTHLEQYLEGGEEAMATIDEDLIFDLAERMERAKFHNRVVFNRKGNDFVSRENHFSMRSMTAQTEYIFAGNVVDMKLYQRAKLESLEVEKLDAWFDAAAIGGLFIVESLPLTDKEKYTIVRLYEKIGATDLTEHIITLHNSTVEIFNQLHDEVGVNVAESKGVMDLLGNKYSVEIPEDTSADEFIDQYIGKYDSILAGQNPGKQYSFGLEKTTDDEQRDDMEMVRRQKALRSVYLDNVRALGESGGRTTDRILSINEKLKLGMNLGEGSVISTAQARSLLDSSLQYVAATLNLAPKTALEKLAIDGNSGIAYKSAGHYGGQARDAGIRYEGPCPSGPGSAAVAEATALARNYRLNKDPTKCVKCPDCKSIVDLPKTALKEGAYHCLKCKTTYKNGQRISYLELEMYKKESFNLLAMLMTGWQIITHEVRVKQLLKRRAGSHDKHEQKRLGKQLEDEQKVMQKLGLAS